jgi:hypothetical protein
MLRGFPQLVAAGAEITARPLLTTLILPFDGTYIMQLRNARRYVKPTDIEQVVIRTYAIRL